jgi:hypothetical protein
VFDVMRAHYAYKDGVPGQQISLLCNLAVFDCDTLALVFAAALRGDGIPARVVF